MYDNDGRCTDNQDLHPLITSGKHFIAGKVAERATVVAISGGIWRLGNCPSWQQCWNKYIYREFCAISSCADRTMVVRLRLRAISQAYLAISLV
jgi:hypothetical protein